jgi:hypothetical protein
MKHLFCLLILFCLSIVSFAQNTIPEFHVPMYFEDGVGNKDTVYAGFDINAEWAIQNGDFGEKNISNKPWKQDFEVRLGRVPTVLSKIDIQKEKCADTLSTQVVVRTFHVLYLKAKHFPIKWSWDSTKFKNNCTINSFYDRSAKSYLFSQIWLVNAQHFRKFGGQTILTESYIKNIKKNDFNYDFIDPISGVDSIKSICFYFLDKKRLAYEYAAANDLYETEVKISPNPTNDKLTLSIKETINLPEKTQLQILHINGQILQQQTINTSNNQLEVDVSFLSSGLYFIQLRSSQGLLYTGKFVKID